ncbi:MAG: PspC domain-containing protein [Flavobacteriaceae bacterium]|jgi:phage shock protein PspC (stress-responsive transcriptional regulator)|nr:PspC domain-containing protein [Flavobacteriaceae bacterium]MBT6704615.1 PspC domain-containing protein [Flavobacteriaceae bacterium]|tara:strand:- start:406 stop:2058 length:1653 start_codon:yes stop_codon:yes gene_type:complete
MNKTVNINLAGTFFHIDEDAFAKLTRYLDAIRRSFSDLNGQEEIIKDIEARISELFSEKINNTSQVITIKELDEVIAVMGQPEDYMVDEEIFDDASSDQKNQTRNQSFYKQLFRDTDNKFIAGVSSGLGHYFSVDAIWIRLAWIAMVLLGFGAPILVYIVLWVLIPEALTTSEKLKMNREPVNISNIEKKIKEELKNASDKIKEVDYDKYKDNAQKGVNTFFSTIGKIFAGIFSVFCKFFGILLIILSLSTIIGLIVGLFTTGTFGFVLGDNEVFDYASIVLVASFPFWLIVLLVFLIVGIPAFALFILGLKLIITNLKSIGMTAKIILFVLWIFSIIGLSILGVKQATEQAYDGDYITENSISIKTTDTLKIEMLSNNRYEYDASRSGSFYLKSDEYGNKIIYSSNIRLIVRSTNDSVAKVFLEHKAEGSSFDNAKERAEAIDYQYTFKNNTLTLNSYFTTDIANKYRGQEVEVVLYLPLGTVLFADNNTYSYHSNSSRYNDILNNGDEEKYLLIQKSKTICLDCPKQLLGKENPEDETWENRLNKSYE